MRSFSVLSDREKATPTTHPQRQGRKASKGELTQRHKDKRIKTRTEREKRIKWRQTRNKP